LGKLNENWIDMVALLVIMPVSKSMAGCYGRTDARPQSRFILRGAEAFDTKTGLTWQRCSLGMTWNVKRGCVGEIMSVGLDEAIKTAETLSGKWRVPSGPELESIVDRACGSPVVDSSVFPDIQKDEDGEANYWTTNPVGTANLYFFDFMNGQADGHTRGLQLAVRLVRNQ
jgi:hypothetical protein